VRIVHCGEHLKKSQYLAPSVRKAFQILEAIANSSSGLGISELAKHLKIGKSTVHGITSGLEDLGVLVRDPLHKRYTLGYTLLELSRRTYTRIELRAVARKTMEVLMERVGETVFLGVMNGDHVTILDVVESQHAMKITSPPGTRLPLLAGATGRAFLAQLERDNARAIVERMGLGRYTPRSITDPRRFLKEVEETGQRGYAIDDEEYIPGIRAIASPIQTPTFPPAAIWVAGFTSSLTDRKMERVPSEIRKAAQEIRDLMREHLR